MPREKLTELKVKALNTPGRYGDGGGLWLQVRDAKHKSWLYRYTTAGRQRQLGLGAFPVVGLKDARAAALDAARAVLTGQDPIAQKRTLKAQRAAESAKAMTFKAVAGLYLAAHEPTWRNEKHKYQWRQTLETHAYPAFGEWPVQDVDTGAVMKVIEPVWRDMPETATRLRGRIETVLDYATARGWRTGDNPARWRGHIANLLPPRAQVAKVEHHAAMPYAEVAAFMAELRQQEGNAAKALDFTVLTAARTMETICASWSEIDMTNAVWTVPGDRMKAGREHRVPLSDSALRVLTHMLPSKPADGDGYVFPSSRPRKPMSNMAMTMLLRRLGRGDLTVHGFRSTFRQWAAEQSSATREVAELALAHTLKDKTEAAYQRSDLFDRRKALMAEWAGFCAGGVTAPVAKAAE